ncbi:ABC transporter ATP-binding protein [Streptococcus suis]|uniref:Membrane spanning protein n=1 Tax=Streptococcus suis TaxID=1307 RepID=A0A2H4I750_STRSU|nr:ABC transporter ATP-binding protein [Streptococcus suis]ARS43239.1 Putative membrane spanning protein [Streptococcus suis]NQK82358.1 ABC transporter ATP-binding protein [Streptococcus suis]HEM4053584.1 ABC transporter ATP-binding protein [Streptococcus suis]HEM4672502.1 ABC transporter ATP-binding protein [Streptococcus suis]HEM6017393.1 ABC transporter ATP-binding protein [Streptococcus suis]
MAKKLIEAEQITKSFGDNTALNAISFEIFEGQIFGFLGPSGSGKTTMINILTGQMQADSGRGKLLGKDSSSLIASDLEEVGIVSDKSGFYEKLSLEKNLLIYGKMYGVNKEEIAELLKKVGLFDSKDKVAEKLSTGMKQRMHLARALINQPKVLFLDEPTSGLDPTTSKTIHELLLMLKKQGTTIFLTTHDMSEATLLCDGLALLNKGNLIEQGTPREIIKKHHQDKKLRVTFNDFREEELTFYEFQHIDTKNVIYVHSCEPTLEEIFIKLTGDELNV